MDIAAIITAIVGAVIGVIGIIISLITAISTARKNDLDALEIIVKSVQAENVRLVARIVVLENEKVADKLVINNQATQILKLERQVSILQRKVIELGGKIDTGPLDVGKAADE